MTPKQLQRLELRWVGKDDRPRPEPRLLLTDPELSFAVPAGLQDNVLIQGDNLLALKSLQLDPQVRGHVKCVFIDPPYNTGSAFTHYDDGLEHSIWLTLMRDRLELLRDLLHEDGSLWISLDDNEVHYLKVMCDEIFGRGCFIADIAWKKRDGAPNDRKIGSTYDHVLVYARARIDGSKKTRAEAAFNLMPRTEKADAMYKVFTEPGGPDPRGAFRKIDTTANGKGGRFVQSLFYPLVNPYTGIEVWPREGTCWRHNKEDMARLQADGRLYWGVSGTATTPMRKLYASEAKAGMAAPTIWDDVGFNQHAAQEIEQIFGSKAAFETPKPEALIERVLQIATRPGDLVLDSFAGSGTTGAVAHKMGRRWIMVELGDHASTHIVPRMRQVVDGTDQGGVSRAQGWKGGGGFRFCRLAPSLMQQDPYGRLVLNPEYDQQMLAEAICRLEGFRYAPDETHPWMQGSSTERDYLYVSAVPIGQEHLHALSEDVGEHRSLLVYAPAFLNVDLYDFANLTLKKLPTALQDRCDWTSSRAPSGVGQGDALAEVAEPATGPDLSVAPQQQVGVLTPAGQV